MLSFGEKGQKQQFSWCKILTKSVNCGSRRIRESVKNAFTQAEKNSLGSG